MHKSDPKTDINRIQLDEKEKLTKEFQPEHVPDPAVDYNAAMREELASLRAEVEAMRKERARGQEYDDGPGPNVAQIPMLLPPKPEPIPKPTGIRWAKQRLNTNNTVPDGDATIFVYDLPDDLRICPYCKRNVATEYNYPISAQPTAEQQIELGRLHAIHMREAKMLKDSKDQQERRHAADHVEVRVWKLGPTPDEVAWLDNKSWTAEEMNTRRLKEWERDCQMAVRNR